MSPEGLTIREVVARTGVEAATLRIWEQRHGFPKPERLPSGHRRYSQLDVELIRRVVRDRESGLELRAAVQNARRAAHGDHPVASEDSVYAGLRRRRPDLAPNVLPKRCLVALSRAIEDEWGVRARGGMLFGGFQRERFYRQSQRRWRDLAGPADAAMVLADFPRLREPPDAPTEIPVGRTEPIAREWCLICDGRELTAMLAAWERPGQDERPDGERDFETVWSVEPELVRDAALVTCSIAERSAAKLVVRVRELVAEPLDASGPHIATLTSLTNRMVAYVGGVTPLPAPRSS